LKGNSSLEGYDVVAKLAAQDLPTEQAREFIRFLKRKKIEELNSFIVSPHLDPFIGILREPHYVPLETFANLTDWQIVFLYLVPSVERAVREIEYMAEVDRR
jgi:hypothetical protein